MSKAERIAQNHADHRELTTARLNPVGDDIQDLWLNRHIWRTTSEIAASSPAVAQQPYFVYWLSSRYAQAACVAIRRLSDRSPRSNSLVAILRGIAENTVAYPCPFWAPDDYRGADGNLDAVRIEQDITELRTAAATVSAYVNDRLAHLDRSPSAPVPDLHEIDAAVDLLGTLLKRYLLLLTGEDLHPITPLMLFPWTSVFETAWTDKPDQPETVR